MGASLVTFATCAATPLWAAPEPPPTAADGVIEVRVAASPLESLADDSPRAATLLEKEELRARAPGVLSEVLRGATGVHLQSTTPGQASPFVRGLTGSGVLHLVDAMRLNHAMYRSAPNPDLALIDPWIVERAGVVRGPASILYGSDAMGGAVLIETRRPRFQSEAWEVRGALSTRLGSADLSAGGRVEGEIGRRGFGARAGVSYLAAGDLRSGGGRQVPTDYAWSGADLALGFEPAPRHESSLDLQLLRQPESPRYDQLVAGFGESEPASETWRYEPLERLFVHARHEIERPFPGRVERLRFDAAFQRIRDDRRTRDFGVPLETREHNTSELLGFAARGVSLVGDSLELAWGADAYLDQVSSRAFTRDLAAGTGAASPSRFPDGSRMNSYGAYLHGSQPLGSRVRLEGGLRYSHFDLELAATQVTGRSKLQLDDVTGGIALLWEAWTGTYLVANLHRGFRAPNVFDSGTLGPRPGNRFNVPAQDLEPEAIYTLDLGAKLDRERVRGEAFVFYSYYDEKIESVLTGAVTPDGRDVVQSSNIGRVQLLGLEAAGELRLRPGWALTGNLLWIFGEQRDADQTTHPADRVPPLQGRLGLRHDAGDSLWIEPYLRLAAPQRRLSPLDERDPRIDPDGTEGWVTLNLELGWRWSERVSGVLLLENLTDAAYREHGSGVDAPGFNAVVSLRLGF